METTLFLNFLKEYFIIVLMGLNNNSFQMFVLISLRNVSSPLKRKRQGILALHCLALPCRVVFDVIQIVKRDKRLIKFYTK